MKNILKNVGVGLLILVLILGLIFGYGYYKKVKRDLVNYNIQEKLVVKFENDNNKYLVNLNNLSYKKYNLEYEGYGYDFKVNWNNENDVKKIYNRLIYNQNNEYYFDYKLGIYNQNNERVFRFINSGFFEAYWSNNGNYLIVRDGSIARMFGLLLSIETAHPIINIVEPDTGKNIELLIKDNNGKILRIEKILGYKLDN